MPFNGSGVYSLPTNSFAQPVADTTIDETDAAALWADFVTAFNKCVVSNETSSPILLNPKILTKVLDTNSNELLEFGTTGSAVNHIKLTNAATGNVPVISTAGEADIGIDFENSEGEELLQLVATATAVNNVRITNATTGNAAKIDVSETNGDLQLAGNGTGGVYGSANFGTAVATTSGTEVEYTSIPSWVKKITVSISGVSLSGTDDLEIVLGDSGGYETTGYDSYASELVGGTFNNVTDALRITDNGTAATGWHGAVYLNLTDATSNTWTLTGSVCDQSASKFCICAGGKALSATLDRIKIAPVGTDTFDGGQLNIIYEG